MMRKMIGAAKPVLKISHEGDKFELETQMGPKTQKISFTIGEDTDIDTPSGYVMKVVICNIHLSMGSTLKSKTRVMMTLKREACTCLQNISLLQ